jgi:hypothetical protein
MCNSSLFDGARVGSVQSKPLNWLTTTVLG